MPDGPTQRPWLNRQRIRIHATLLAVCLWAVYAITMATPGLRDRNGLIKGTDFLHFYTLGSLALENNGYALYDVPQQTARLSRLVPEASHYSYAPLYGPQVSLFFAPLASLPYTTALAIWLSFNTLIYFLCCYAVWRTCTNLRNDLGTCIILTIAFPGFFHLIVWGQSSGLALVFFVLAYLALKSGKQFLAGLAIGCLIFKPHLGLAAAVAFLLVPQWAVVAGALIGAAIQLSVGWIYYGTAVMRNYWEALTRIGGMLPQIEPRPYQMHSLRGFWMLLVPSPQAAWVLYGISTVVVLILLVRCWKSGLPLGVRYAALLIATVLVSPHLTAYDLVILAPVFLLLADWLVETGVPRLGILIYLCFPLFLFGPVARATHMQLSVIVLAALLWTIARVSNRESEPVAA